MQDRNPVSIVLPIYNGEKYLKEQLDSIIHQSQHNLEIIIVDDNSKDRSLDIVERFAEKDKRIIVHKNASNLGVAANFLKGLSLTMGEFICFCDQDDYWREDKIEVLKALIEKDTKTMLVYSDVEVCDKDLNTLFPSFNGAVSIKPKRGYLKELSFLKNITPGCTMMFRRKVKEGLVKMEPDAPFMHDHLALIVASGLGRIDYTPQKLVKYRQHSANNIGAFYDSMIDKDRIIRELRQKVEYFKRQKLSALNLDLDKMLSFCEALKGASLKERLRFIDCYLFLRNDTFLYKASAFLDCLSPMLYSRLKAIFSNTLKTQNSFFTWVKKVAVLGWIFVVLAFFVKEFIFYKVGNILR